MANFAKRNKTPCLSKSNEDLPITSHYAIPITRSCISIGERERKIGRLEGRFSDKAYLPRITATSLASCITSQQTSVSWSERYMGISDSYSGLLPVSEMIGLLS